VRAHAERRQGGIDRSVEGRRQRDNAIVVPERIELPSELERDDLGAAALGAGDEMQDAQPRHVAMSRLPRAGCHEPVAMSRLP
jgi:hypothetical protein